MSIQFSILHIHIILIPFCLPIRNTISFTMLHNGTLIHAELTCLYFTITVNKTFQIVHTNYYYINILITKTSGYNNSSEN